MRRLGLLLLVIAIIMNCTPIEEHGTGKPAAFTTDDKVVYVYTTAKDTDLRLSPTDTTRFYAADQPREDQVHVFLDPQKKFQTFLGIGGALTDASAEVFAKLPAEKQEQFLRSYYDRQAGIGYTLARTSIHSCDFSSASFTYVQEGDAELKTFSIEHDRQFRIPFIKRAIQAAGGSLRMYVSPWSPPAFMKSNGNMLRGGSLLPEYFQSWATYYAKFIKAYEAEGIPIWGLTIQNEPMATQTWESCIYTAQEERDFLKHYLGPTLSAEGLGDKRIIIWDHNRDLITHRVHTILSDPAAEKYVWGIGFHWYETWTGSTPKFENLDNVAEAFPSKKLIFTEGCAERFNPDHYEYWPNAERYGLSMVNDFNQGTVAWTDWNVLLDEIGGPNHVGNFCFAPVHANTRTGELTYTPSYYYIGHFSKFIQPHARRISTASSRSHLQSTSFMNPDGTIAAIIMNQSDQTIDYQCYIGEQSIRQTIPAHAMQTLVF